MEQSELAQQMTTLTTQLEKVFTEINAKLTELGDAIEAADDVAPEVVTAFDALKASVQKTDDIVPDAPPPTE